VWAEFGRAVLSFTPAPPSHHVRLSELVLCVTRGQASAMNARRIGAEILRIGLSRLIGGFIGRRNA